MVYTLVLGQQVILENLLADKDIKVGDKLTVIATKTTYKDEPQLANGIYFSHESAE